MFFQLGFEFRPNRIMGALVLHDAFGTHSVNEAANNSVLYPVVDFDLERPFTYHTFLVMRKENS